MALSSSTRTAAACCSPSMAIEAKSLRSSKGTVISPVPVAWPAPKLMTAEMVEAMAPGSVIVDLAAERGGNCELTVPDQEVVHKGVTIIGPSNPAALVPYHASQMYAKNIVTFLLHLLGKEGAKEPTVPIDPADEITRETLLTRGGDVVHPRVKELLAQSR